MFFALLSEVPYRLLFGNDGNVIFTLLIGYLALWLRDMVKAKTNSDIYAFFVFVGALVVSFLSGCDWGYIGILLVFAFYDGKKDRLKAVFYPLSVYVFVFLSALAEAVLWVGFDGFYINYIQFAGVLSVPVVLLYNGKRCPRIKYLFYFYYPLHMLLLVGISSLTGN